jgi:hypothetical protein
MIIPSEWVSLFPEAGCFDLDSQTKDQLLSEASCSVPIYCFTKDFFPHN